MNKKTCKWVENAGELYTEYHDQDWGVPVHDDRLLFEMLILEGAQAGLSWLTVLKKRSNYKKAFNNFEVRKVAKYDEKKFQELLKNEGIIRNKLKLRSATRNAKVFLEIQKEFGSFDKYIWQFVDNKPLQNKIKKMSEIQASTKISDVISKDLKKRGMNFVGSTIIYAYMQSVGLVNDHEVSCFRYSKLK